MICSTNFWRMIGVGYHLGDELVADIGKRSTVRSIHVVDRAVAHVLQGPGHAGRAMVFQDRNGHDLVDRLGHQLAEMRAVLAVVFGIGAVIDQIHPDERVVIEARDRIVAKRGKIKRELVGRRDPARPSGRRPARIL